MAKLGTALLDSRLRALSLFLSLSIAAATLVVAERPVAARPPGGLMRTQSQAVTEFVANPSATASTNGWTTAADGARVALSRVTGIAGPFMATTALAVSRQGGTGTWAYALGALVGATSGVNVGGTYRFSVWVQNRGASPASVGVLIGNGSRAHRPTLMSQYRMLSGAQWQRFQVTFIADAKVTSDTGFYIALPASGSFDLQFTAASFMQITANLPAAAGTSQPSRVISFAGTAGSAPNSGEWAHNTGGNGWGNGELQTYTDRTSNAALDGAGHLVITARRETLAGADGITRDYTSGRLVTDGRVTIAAGSYVEVPVTAPTGAGLWPAVWLLGANFDTVGWPACGEIDAFEVWGADPTHIHTALHVPSTAESNGLLSYDWAQAGGSVAIASDVAAQAHVIGIYFDGQQARFYVDRVLVRVVYATDVVAVGATWPFAAGAFVIANLAIANDAGLAATQFPAVMTLGAISIYKGLPSGLPAVPTRS